MIKIACFGSWDFPDIRTPHWRAIQYILNASCNNILFLDIYQKLDYYENKLKDFNPDILFFCQKEPLIYLPKLRKFSKYCIFWFCDVWRPEKFPQIKLNGEIDYGFFTNEGVLDTYKNSWKINKVKYLSQGCDLEAQLKSKEIINNIDSEKIYDLIYVGNINKNFPGYENRFKYLNILRERYKLKIIDPRGNDINNRIDSYKLLNYYSESKISLGIDITNNERKYTSNRTFLAMGFGSCYLCNYFDGVEEIFNVGKDLMIYRNFDQLLENINLLLNNDKLRKEIALTAHNTIINNHTYQHKIDIIFNEIKKETGLIY